MLLPLLLPFHLPLAPHSDKDEMESLAAKALTDPMLHVVLKDLQAREDPAVTQTPVASLQVHQPPWGSGPRTLLLRRQQLC